MQVFGMKISFGVGVALFTTMIVVLMAINGHAAGTMGIETLREIGAFLIVMAMLYTASKVSLDPDQSIGQ